MGSNARDHLQAENWKFDKHKALWALGLRMNFKPFLIITTCFQ
jgi:hypothetical protein